jgi:hypothetical protein
MNSLKRANFGQTAVTTPAIKLLKADRPGQHATDARGQEVRL